MTDQQIKNLVEHLSALRKIIDDLVNELEGVSNPVRVRRKMDKKVLNFAEACEYTGWSESYMYKLTSAGMIPFSKPLNKTLYFDREKLDAFLLSNSSTSAQEKEIAAATYITTHKPKSHARNTTRRI